MVERLVGVQVDAHDRERLSVITLDRLLDGRERRDARGAPGRPEVEEEVAAAVLPWEKRRSGRIRRTDVREGSTDGRRRQENSHELDPGTVNRLVADLVELIADWDELVPPEPLS